MGGTLLSSGNRGSVENVGQGKHMGSWECKACFQEAALQQTGWNLEEHLVVKSPLPPETTYQTTALPALLHLCVSIPVRCVCQVVDMN